MEDAVHLPQLWAALRVVRLEQAQAEARIVAVGNQSVRADDFDAPVVGAIEAAVCLDAILEADVPAEPSVPPFAAAVVFLVFAVRVVRDEADHEIHV